MKQKNVRPIANLKTRMAEYEEERIDWIRQCVVIVLLGMGVASAFLYVIARITEDEAMSAYWMWFGPIMGAFLSYWPVLLTKPECPHPSDVKRDQELRRYFGMDDKVED